MKIAFFGHDAGDAAIRRRVQAFESDGMAVDGYMMRRDERLATEWGNVDLGRTFDGDFINRIRRIFSGARIAATHKAKLQSADIIYARNLDMMACAFLTKRKLSLDTPVVYECLDVHRLLVRQDIIGAGLRWIEKALLRRTCGLVVSSPAFVKYHFERHYPGHFRSFLIENRLPSDAASGARPIPSERGGDIGAGQQSPLRIGWVGILRCQRSFDVLKSVADQFGEQVDIRLYGKPARTEISVFEPEIASRDNMTYFGPYQAPEGLEAIYSELDIVWAGDFMEAGFNSAWLLPNRIYEGGYYGTPPIVMAGTQSSDWVSQKQCGFVVDEPLEAQFPALVKRLLSDRAAICAKKKTLLSLPDEVFVQPRGDFARMFAEMQQAGGVS